jgi:phosphatidylglycerol:prolipoprotein diacylglycerol transferase
MSFAMIVGVGAVLGLAWAAWRAPARQAGLYVDGGLWVLFGSLLASRLAFVVVNWSYFQTHFDEALQVWLGGLSWPGALAGGLFSLVMFALFNHASLGELADGLTYLLLPLVVASWMGCWQLGCAYGRAVQAWWSLPTVDEWGVWALRWPVQLFGALLAVAAFFLLEWGRPRLKRSGQAGSLALLSFAVLMAGLSLLRADPLQSWRVLRLDTWAALFFIILSIPLCVVSFFPRRLSS